MPWIPSYPGEIPTLGYYVIDWITENLQAPDSADPEPFVPYAEQEDFIINFYAIDIRNGKRLYNSGVISRPRGWGKSPFLGALAIVEGLADVVPDGWDAYGQPVGKPWSRVRTPLVQIAAVSEEQTANTWNPLREMLSGPVQYNYPGVEPLESFVNLPKGKIQPITSSARTVKGNKPVFAVLDQTEEWIQSNGGKKLAEVMHINATKIGGSVIESPNAFTPGEDSVAEDSARVWAQMQAGEAKFDGLYYDHREAPPETDLSERESLMVGLRVAYGDSSGHPDGCVIHEPPCDPGHVDLDVVANKVWDPRIPAQLSRADFLNQITHASDAYITHPEWEGVKDLDKFLEPRDTITLGFDGSRGKAKGKPDATALIGCRIRDKHIFEIKVWEAPNGPKMNEWSPPLGEIEAAIDAAFKLYDVAAFYADPAKDWRSYVNKWEAKYGAKIKVRLSAAHPFEWWMTGGRSHMNQRAIELFEGAVRNQEITHDGSFALTNHMLNARRRIKAHKLTLSKENDYSSNKIDAAVCAVLAYQACVDCIAKGIGLRKTTGQIKRIR